MYVWVSIATGTNALDMTVPFILTTRYGSCAVKSPGLQLSEPSRLMPVSDQLHRASLAGPVLESQSHLGGGDSMIIGEDISRSPSDREMLNSY